MIRKLLALILPDEWEGHHDYCDVFDEGDFFELTASNKPCSEDCANHPGDKILLGKYTKRIKEI